MDWHRFVDYGIGEVLGGKRHLPRLRLCKCLWSIRPERQAVLRLRLVQMLEHYGRNTLVRRQLAILATRFGIHVEPRTLIGRGLRLPHPTSIVIGKGLRIGARCLLYQQVTLAAAPLEHEPFMARIGDDVTLFPGAKVVGEGRVGNRVIVGANAVVADVFGDDVVLGGVPARVIREVRPGERTGADKPA
ncbi:hypothetical protein [Halomonas maura]|uniref:hypothetical protein n=1 Tax=Halomonas maura TaxID=117606 RepID=UPI0025B45B48|nr:hypothetical protein [Halomonas maura]MDN3554973.1 hypothetical protein [Halomonas maura]